MFSINFRRPSSSEVQKKIERDQQVAHISGLSQTSSLSQQDLVQAIRKFNQNKAANSYLLKRAEKSPVFAHHLRTLGTQKASADTFKKVREQPAEETEKNGANLRPLTSLEARTARWSLTDERTADTLKKAAPTPKKRPISEIEHSERSAKRRSHKGHTVRRENGVNLYLFNGKLYKIKYDNGNTAQFWKPPVSAPEVQRRENLDLQRALHASYSGQKKSKKQRPGSGLSQ